MKLEQMEKVQICKVHNGFILYPCGFGDSIPTLVFNDIEDLKVWLTENFKDEPIP